eukprot:403357305
MDLTSISLLSQNRVELMRMREKNVYILTAAGASKKKEGESIQEQIKQLCWFIQQAYKLQNQRNLRVFDENGDDISSDLEEMAVQNEWNQNKGEIFAAFTQDADEIQDFEKNFRNTVARFDTQVGSRQRADTVKINRDQLNKILSSNKTVENYEESFQMFQKSINQELKVNRHQLVDALDEIQQQNQDLHVLDRVYLQLSTFQHKTKQQKNKVINLRTQIDEIESQNSRVVQEEQNYKKLSSELKQLLSHIKIDNSQQQFLLKVDYNDESQLSQIYEYLENIKLSLSGKQQALDIQYVHDINLTLIKLKQKITMKFVESITRRMKEMNRDKMNYFDLISRGFNDYLQKRVKILGILAEISIEQSSKDVYKEISALLNRFYRNISEEFSQYMQTVRFQEILGGFSKKVISPYQLDMQMKLPKVPSSFLAIIQREVVFKSEVMTLDEDMGEFLLNLLYSIINFDLCFFEFFQCGEMQLVKLGDKSFNQFIEICLQDLYDQSKSIIECCLKINPFTLYGVACLAQSINESISKKKAKQGLQKYLPISKKINFKEIKNLYYMDIFQKLADNSSMAFQTFIDQEMKFLDGAVINTRYCGILDPIKKLIISVEYCCIMCKRLQNKRIGTKLLNQLLLKYAYEWLQTVAQVKLKYKDLVMFENLHFMFDSLQNIKQKCEKSEFLDSIIVTLKKNFDESLSSYLQTTIFYILPYLKDQPGTSQKDQNTIYGKAFGSKNLGGNFEKMVKRIHKHLCKENFLLQVVVNKLKSNLKKMLDKGIKEYQITSANLEQFDYVLQEEGSKIIQKYSKK